MTTAEQRPQQIRQILTEAFAPDRLEIVDDSHKHAGHASAGGAGHFRVMLVTDHFAGKSPIERHRMVFKALDAMMNSEIHALTIDARAPEES